MEKAMCPQCIKVFEMRDGRYSHNDDMTNLFCSLECVYKYDEKIELLEAKKANT